MPLLRIYSLDEARLGDAAGELAARAQPFAPQAVIGIQSGGYIVAQLVAEQLDVPLLAITARRPSTAKKQKVSGLKQWLAKLPSWITNLLRIIEHMVFTQWLSPRPQPLALDAAELAVIESQCRALERVLIVDDAVDSGATLAAVLMAVKERLPQAKVGSAAITVTTRAPLAEPDLSLYRYVLCRFPWSLDAKN